MITCDAAGCGATETEKAAGLDLCKRCTRSLAAHLTAWLADPVAQRQARSDQAARDKVAADAEAATQVAHAAAVLEAQVQHVAKRKGFDPQLLRDKLVKGATLHEAIRGVLLDQHKAKLEADQITAKRANAEHKKKAKAELAAKLKSGELDPKKHPIAHFMLAERAGEDMPKATPEKK